MQTDAIYAAALCMPPLRSRAGRKVHVTIAVIDAAYAHLEKIPFQQMLLAAVDTVTDVY